MAGRVNLTHPPHREWFRALRRLWGGEVHRPRGSSLSYTVTLDYDRARRLLIDNLARLPLRGHN